MLWDVAAIGRLITKIALPNIVASKQNGRTKMASAATAPGSFSVALQSRELAASEIAQSKASDFDIPIDFIFIPHLMWDFTSASQLQAIAGPNFPPGSSAWFNRTVHTNFSNLYCPLVQ